MPELSADSQTRSAAGLGGAPGDAGLPEDQALLLEEQMRDHLWLPFTQAQGFKPIIMQRAEGWRSRY